MDFWLIFITLIVGFWLLWFSWRQENQKEELQGSSGSDKPTVKPKSKNSSVRRSNDYSYRQETQGNYDDYDWRQETQENYDNWKEQMMIERQVEQQYEQESWGSSSMYDDD